MLRAMTFLLGALLLLTPVAARAHAEGVIASTPWGMLTFKAQAGLNSPAHGAVGLTNPISVTSSSTAHWVMVTAPAPGGTVNIDYRLSVGMNGGDLGNAKSGTNQQVTLDGNGTWATSGAFSSSATVAIPGQHLADATAWIQAASQSGSLATKYHAHTFN